MSIFGRVVQRKTTNARVRRTRSPTAPRRRPSSDKVEHEHDDQDERDEDVVQPEPASSPTNRAVA